MKNTGKVNKSIIYFLLMLGLLITIVLIFFNIKRNNSKIEEQKTSREVENITTTSTTSTTFTTTTTTKQISTKASTTTTETAKSTTTKKASKYETTAKGFKIEYRDGAYYIGGILVANKSYPLDKDYIPKGTHASASSSTSHCADCIIEDGYQAFQKMKSDLAQTGINMWIQSGYRSYSLQDSLYNRYVSRSGKIEADTYSARPGHSEHQTGYAFDVCASKDGKNYPCITSEFNGTEPALWLRDNCYKYGFILRYPEGKDNETGYKHESWHFRYVGIELATKLYNSGNWITLEEYLGIDSKYDN